MMQQMEKDGGRTWADMPVEETPVSSERWEDRQCELQDVSLLRGWGAVLPLMWEGDHSEATE